MSTLFFGLTLGVLLLVFARWAPVAQPATISTLIVHRPTAFRWPSGVTGWLHAIWGSPLPPSGNTERAIDMKWSPAARLGLGFQPPRRVVTGRGARIRLWHRFRSLVLLFLIITVGGLTLAGAVGLLLFTASFLIEQAIG